MYTFISTKVDTTMVDLELNRMYNEHKHKQIKGIQNLAR